MRNENSGLHLGVAQQFVSTPVAHHDSGNGRIFLVHLNARHIAPYHEHRMGQHNTGTAHTYHCARFMLCGQCSAWCTHDIWAIRRGSRSGLTDDDEDLMGVGVLLALWRN